MKIELKQRPNVDDRYAKPESRNIRKKGIIMSNLPSFILGVIVGVIVGVIGILTLLLLMFLLRPWLRSHFSGGKISLANIIGIYIRGNPPMLLVDAYLKLLHSGKDTSFGMVESCYIANRNKINDADSLVMVFQSYEREIEQQAKLK